MRAATQLSGRDLGAERNNRVERRFRPLDMRRMAAAFENEALNGRGRARLDRADLLECSVRVVVALDQKRGTRQR
jgi:hypothetical protein